MRQLLNSVYAWGRRTLPITWRRAIRRALPVERLFRVRKPNYDFVVLPPEELEIRPGRPDVICLPVIEWNFRRQRPQQLLEGLARRGGRIFYADFAPIREPRRVADRVYLFGLPGARRENLFERPMTERGVAASGKKVLDLATQFGVREAVIFVEAPYWRPLAEELKSRTGWKLVYDCLDNHAAYPGSRSRFLKREEELLARAADLVCASAQLLLDRMKLWARRAFLLRGADDFEAFSAAAAPSGNIRPRIGYFGVVAEWVDLELVRELARRRPGWDFEIVGSAWGTDVPTPFSLPNVFFRGERPFSEMAVFLRGFDVSIIPFVLNELTAAMDVVKVYEMLASGKPVVATPLPELGYIEKQGLITFGRDAVEFAAAIESALTEDNPSLRARRIAFARENDWSSRAAVLETELRGLFPRVSVIVVTCDNLMFNRACLESLDARTEWPNLELIFVDNGSGDGTVTWLQEEAARRPDLLKIIANGENRGFGPAVNQGLAAASGDFLCLLNNDTVVSRGWLSALVAHLQANPSLGMVSPSTNDASNESRVEAPYPDVASMPDWARRFTRRNAGEIVQVPMLAMFCVVFPRRVFETVGFLDEQFLVGMFEDDDYSRRVRNAGYELGCARDSFVHHRGRGTFHRLGEEYYWDLYRDNQRKYLAKWNLPRV